MNFNYRTLLLLATLIISMTTYGETIIDQCGTYLLTGTLNQDKTLTLKKGTLSEYRVSFRNSGQIKSKHINNSVTIRAFFPKRKKHTYKPSAKLISIKGTADLIKLESKPIILLKKCSK